MTLLCAAQPSGSIITQTMYRGVLSSVLYAPEGEGKLPPEDVASITTNEISLKG